LFNERKGIPMTSPQSGEEHSSKFGSKAAFIRSQPLSMSAKEVVEAASHHGLKISVNHVYNLRTAAAKKEQSATSAADISIQTGDHRLERARSTGRVGDVERQLRAAIAEVGLMRSREIFEAVAEAFRAR
jgi:hypothetical protein